MVQGNPRDFLRLFGLRKNQGFFGPKPKKLFWDFLFKTDSDIFLPRDFKGLFDNFSNHCDKSLEKLAGGIERTVDFSLQPNPKYHKNLAKAKTSLGTLVTQLLEFRTQLPTGFGDGSPRA